MFPGQSSIIACLRECCFFPPLSQYQCHLYSPLSSIYYFWIVCVCVFYIPLFLSCPCPVSSIYVLCPITSPVPVPSAIVSNAACYKCYLPHSFLSICLSFLPCCFLSYLSGSLPCPAFDFVLSIHLLVSCPTPQAVSCPIHPHLFTCVWSVLPLYLSCPLSYLCTCLVLPFCDMSYLSTCLVVPLYLLCPIFLPILSYLSMWHVLPFYLSCPTFQPTMSYLSTHLFLPFYMSCPTFPPVLSYLSTCLVLPFYLFCPTFLPVLSYLSTCVPSAQL